MQETHPRRKAARDALSKKTRRLAALRSDALRKHERVFALDSQFKKRANLHQSQKRLSMFRGAIQKLHVVEDPLRVPDQTGFLRSYSSLDKSTWTMTEMREWYVKNAAPLEVDSSPSSTLPSKPWAWAGATARTFHSSSMPALPRAATPSRSSPPLPRSPAVSSIASGPSPPPSSRPSLPSVSSRRPRPHWMDYEAALAESRAADARRAPVDVEPPWLPRPGPPPPVDTMKARERKAFACASYSEDRTLRNSLKKRMQRGEWHSPAS